MQELNTIAREVYNESPPVSYVPKEQPIIMFSLHRIGEYEAKRRYIHGEILYISAKETGNIMDCQSFWIKYNCPFNAAVESFKHQPTNIKQLIYYYTLETRQD